MLDQPKFAVFDVETTGVSPNYNDRMVEIAVVLMDHEGNIETEYDTLINPGRNVGPTWVHGITQKMTEEAPTFDQIAGDLIPLFKDRIIVGHNVHFDLRFLGAEFAHLNYGLPEIDIACTLQMARRIMPGPHKLADCCRYYNVDLIGAHQALDDTHATAKLLAAGLQTGYSLSNFLKPYQFKYLPTADDWPILDPMQTKFNRTMFKTTSQTL